ncbi:MAG: TolC family protein [Anaeromyxobacter sp.]
MDRPRTSRLLVALLAVAAALPARAVKNPTGAEAPLSLADAESLALAHQPELRAARAQTRAAKARLGQSTSTLLPQITGTGSVVRAGGEGLKTGDTWSYGLSGTQPIVDLGAFFNRAASSASASAQEESEKDTLEAVVLGVRTAWFSAAAARDLVEVAKETFANREAHLEQVKGFVEVGTRPEIDLAQARADRASAQVQLITARNDYATALARLNQAMGVVGATDYALAPIEFPAVQGEDAALDALVNEALSRRADLAALARQRDASAASLRSSWSGFAPTLDATGKIGQAGPDLSSTRESWNAGLVLTWPLFQGGRTAAQVREASANLEVLDAQAESVKLAVRLGVEQAWLSVQAARASLEATGEALANAKERLRLADARYQNGLGSGIELNDAQVAETTAAAQEVQARFNLATARASLIRALGR